MSELNLCSKAYGEENLFSTQYYMMSIVGTQIFKSFAGKNQLFPGFTVNAAFGLTPITSTCVERCGKIEVVHWGAKIDSIQDDIEFTPGYAAASVQLTVALW